MENSERIIYASPSVKVIAMSAQKIFCGSFDVEGEDPQPGD